MAHKFYFTGYSDNVVIAGAYEHWLDEHFQGYFLLNNGAVVHAEHCPSDDPDHPGWKLTCEDPSAIRIAAPGEDEEHTDERIPLWLDAPGYADVIIIEAGEPLEILAQGDMPPDPMTPLGVLAFKVAKSINKRMDYDAHQRVTVSVVEEVLAAHLGADFKP